MGVLHLFSFKTPILIFVQYHKFYIILYNIKCHFAFQKLIEN